jgi:hypothetical protein
MVVHKNESKMLKITSESVIMFCNVKRSQDPKDLVPEDMYVSILFEIS